MGRALVTQLSKEIAQNLSKNIKAGPAEKSIDEWIARRIGSSSQAYETLARQAAYNVVLKVFIYDMIKGRFGLDEPSTVSLGSYLASFETAYTSTGWHCFRPTLLDSIVVGCNHRASDLLQRIMSIMKSLRGQSVDLLGRLYEDLIPQEDRRKLGEFYTPQPIAAFMTRWILDKPRRIVDPACGSGGFLIEAIYRLIDLGIKPVDAVRYVHGVDYNPLAVTMATANILLRVPESQPNIECFDFLKAHTARSFENIVCNPPYTRHHELSGEYKEEIARIVGDEAGIRLSRLSSVYVHFLIHSLESMRDGGRMAFITPNEFLDVDYGKILKKFLREKSQIRSFIIFHESSLLFRQALTTACITLVEKGRAQEEVTVIKLESWPDSSTSLIEAIEGTRTSLPGARIVRVPQSSLDYQTKWSRIGEPVAVRSRLVVEMRNLARVKRGVATGANEFFILSDDERKKWKIHQKYLRPIIANSRFVPFVDITEADLRSLCREGMKTWLLDINLPIEELECDPVVKYLAYGQRRGFNKRYLTKTRDLWYSQEHRAIPPIIFPLMIRQNPRFVYNRTQAIISNNLHGVYPESELFKGHSQVEAFLGYLNSSLALGDLSSVGRTYGGGLLKLEPGEVERLPVLDITALAERDINDLAHGFLELCKAARVGTPDAARSNLDEVVKKVTQHT